VSVPIQYKWFYPRVLDNRYHINKRIGEHFASSIKVALSSFFSFFLSYHFINMAHEVHRSMEENFFAFQRQPSFNSSYRSLTASDLISLPSPPVQQYKCRPASDILQAKPIRDKNSPEGKRHITDSYSEINQFLYSRSY
jgi:hypothetical protein